MVTTILSFFNAEAQVNQPTNKKFKEGPQKTISALTPRLGCDGAKKVFDRLTPSREAPRSFFWDPLHVLSVLNRQFNQDLLRVVELGYVEAPQPGPPYLKH